MRLGRGVKTLLWVAILSFMGAAHAHSPGEKPWTFRFSVGNPAPSFVGAGIGYHPQEKFELLTNMGVGWYDDISIQTFSGGARFYLLSTVISPFVGGGVSYFKFSGKGRVQGLDESAFLGFVTGGIDFDFDPLRISAGLNLHFPFRLIFPFVDVGLGF